MSKKASSNHVNSELSEMMKAIVCRRYGPPAVLKLEQIPIPVPGEKEVLVKVKATTINDWDWSLVRGKPYIYRSFYGLFKPKKIVFGVEISGVVETSGPGATRFSTGDRVFGDISLVGYGGWGEYVAVPESALMTIPEEMGLEEAVALPHACGLAIQGLIDEGEIKEGQSLLINGGGGGVGTLGVQIARILKVGKIVGVDHEDKFEIMNELGYDELIDYRETDITKADKKYDVILDTKTSRSPLAYLKILKPHGKYVTVGGSPIRLFQLLIYKRLVSIISGKSLKMLMLQPNKSLEPLASWIRDGKLKSVIDGPYSLEEIPDRLEYFGQGKHLGKVVISL